MSARQRVRTVVYALMIALAGCGGRASLGSGEATTLEVVNRATLDMNVYAVSDAGARERLGTARSLSTTRFTIPDRLVVTALPLRFQVDPVGSTRMHFSDEIPVIRGDTVVLEIPPA